MNLFYVAQLTAVSYRKILQSTALSHTTKDSLVKWHGQLSAKPILTVIYAFSRSPSGNLLLTKMIRGVKVWTTDVSPLHLLTPTNERIILRSIT